MSDPLLTKVLLSNRQYAALLLFTSRTSIPLDEALGIDQRSFGSLFHRQYIDFNNRTKAFAITPLGLKAREMFDNTSVIKEHPGEYFSRRLHTIRALADYQRRNGK